MVYSPDGYSWSQVGYFKDNNPSATNGTNGLTTDWSQTFLNSSGAIFNTFGGHVVEGTNYAYKVVYAINGCTNGRARYSCLFNEINGNVLSSTNYDPATAWPSGDWNMEYSEESLQYGGDVPGTASATAVASTMQFETAQGTWLPVNCGVNGIIKYGNDDPTHYGHSYDACDSQGFFTSTPN